MWSDISSFEFWFRGTMAIVCGGVVGLERQLKGNPAGVRTCMLICLGTCVFVRLGVELQTDRSDPTRMLGQVVTGIGFLGAGVILTVGNLVKGITSAAVVWVTTSIGASIGLDRYGFAVGITSLTVIVLTIVHVLERALPALRRGVHSEATHPESKK